MADEHRQEGTTPRFKWVGRPKDGYDLLAIVGAALGVLGMAWQVFVYFDSQPHLNVRCFVGTLVTDEASSGFVAVDLSNPTDTKRLRHSPGSKPSATDRKVILIVSNPSPRPLNVVGWGFTFKGGGHVAIGPPPAVKLPHRLDDGASLPLWAGLQQLKQEAEVAGSDPNECFVKVAGGETFRVPAPDLRGATGGVIVEPAN